LRQSDNIANRIWNILYPLGMYYVAITIGIFIAQMIFGKDNESYMLCKTIGSLAAIPVVWADYKKDLLLSGRYGVKTPFSFDVIKNILFVLMITILLSIAFNNIISMSPLMSVSKEYENASNAFYGSSIWLELLGSAIITPFLEELLHRGVIYGRLRRMMGIWPAVFISALIFSILHFNIVQFIYAFFLGMVLALFVEKAKSIYTAIIAHVVANGIAVIRTETGFLMNTVDGSISAWLISVGFLLLGLAILIIYTKKILILKKEGTNE